jgi:hypothetical protein
MSRTAIAFAAASIAAVAIAPGLGVARSSHPPHRLNAGLGAIELELRLQPADAPEPLSPPDARVLEGVPDLMQTDPDLGLARGGESHCAPVAASNALMWLGERGLARLLPDGDDARARQIRLVKRLASPAYMATSAHSGTGATGVLKGLDLYLKANGYRFKRLEYQGWRAHQLRYSTGVRIPEPAFVAEGLREGGVALISVGWYRPGRLGGAYRRHGGHWLTVVSAGVGPDGRDQPDALVLHDPAPWSGSEPRSHRVVAEALGEGWLIGEDGPFPSRGYRALRGDLETKRPGEIAIIDGAVVLVP